MGNAEKRLRELEGDSANLEIIKAEVPHVKSLQELEAKWLSEVCGRPIDPESELVQKAVALMLDLEGDLMREEAAKEILRSKGVNDSDL